MMSLKTQYSGDPDSGNSQKSHVEVLCSIVVGELATAFRRKKGASELFEICEANGREPPTTILLIIKNNLFLTDTPNSE